MKRTRRRRGATERFSVSVDPETKRALRKLAAAEFGGNLSALVTDFAEEARRRMAAAAYLRVRRIPKLTEREARAVEAELEREIAAATPRPRRKGRGVITPFVPDTGARVAAERDQPATSLQRNECAARVDSERPQRLERPWDVRIRPVRRVG